MTEQLGRYQLEKRLAVGGMAEVFLALEARPDGSTRTCVVKRMLASLSADRTFIGMFLDEARLAAQLAHPNIAALYDFGESDGVYYLAMEYVPGASLRQVIDDHLHRAQYVPLAAAARIVQQAAMALAAAHSAKGRDGQPLNVVHRDISPQNLMLSTAGVVKLIDFGIAKAATATSRTQAGMIKGKFAYMSPEQIRGDPVDARSDLYALGLVFYELLANRVALAGNSDRAIMESAFLGRVTPLKELRDDIPNDVHAVLSRALVQDRDQRYRSAGQMSADLGAFLLSYPARTTPEELKSLLPQDTQVTAPRKPSSAKVKVVEPTTDPPVSGNATRNLRAPTREGVQEATVVEAAPLAPVLSTGPQTIPDGRTEVADRPIITVVSGPPRWIWGAVAGAVLLATAIAGWSLRRGSGVRPSGQRPVVAVLEFLNPPAGSDLGWAGPALADGLRAALSMDGTTRAAPNPTATQTPKDVGANFVVAGTFLPAAPDGSARVQVRLENAAGGELVAELEDVATATSLGDLAVRLAAALRNSLGLPPWSDDDARRARGFLPANTAAWRDHSLGDVAAARFDFAKARDALMRAVAADPQDARAYLLLARIAEQQGLPNDVAVALANASALREHLPPRERAEATAWRAWLERDGVEAVRILGERARAVPESVEDGIAWATALRRQGDTPHALAELDALRHLPAPDGLDPRIDLEESRLALSALKDGPRAVRAAQRAWERAKAQGALELAARALEARAQAHLAEGELDTAVGEWDQAKTICEAIANKLCQAEVLLESGRSLTPSAVGDRGRQRLEDAARVAREMGAVGLGRQALEALAQLFDEGGDLRAARAAWASAAELTLAAGLAGVRAHALLQLARCDLALGEPTTAAELEEVRTKFAQLDDSSALADVYTLLGQLALQRGALAEAQHDFEKAQAGLGPVGEPARRAQVLEGLAEVAIEQDLSPPAHRLLQEAGALANQAKDDARVAEGVRALAGLEDDESQVSEALVRLQGAASSLRAKKAWADLVPTLTTLAAIAGRHGRVTEAAGAIEEARSHPTQRAWDALRLDIEGTRLEPARAGGPDRFEAARRRAEELHYPRLEWEARMASAEDELAKRSSRTSLRFFSIANDASAKGFTRLSRRALALSRR